MILSINDIMNSCFNGFKEVNMKAPKNIKLNPPSDNEPTLDVTGKGALPDTEVKHIQIRIPVSKHKEMKAYAAEQGITMTDMLLIGYDMYRKKMN